VRPLRAAGFQLVRLRAGSGFDSGFGSGSGSGVKGSDWDPACAAATRALGLRAVISRERRVRGRSVRMGTARRTERRCTLGGGGRGGPPEPPAL
jgi:hypothetical protein